MTIEMKSAAAVNMVFHRFRSESDFKNNPFFMVKGE